MFCFKCIFKPACISDQDLSFNKGFNKGFFVGLIKRRWMKDGKKIVYPQM